MDALAWYRAEHLCECGCGFPKDVAQDPMTEFRVEVPPVPTRCHVRTALAAAQKAYADKPGARPDGALWSVRIRSESGADADGDHR